ncbi:NADPH-dependent F420 reductase [Fluviispira multicolorata]|uniref:DNA-binding protein n=1 Tax=Fluviispira multicolorata TaxID=2654512 RepID=A0A833N704_9BACT|nr:NAD(P)-binding domain-containing protein [Fluviispira multicolorata]KAB8031073.1 DNA-binding protein [Fluviispira multicolorata]
MKIGVLGSGTVGETLANGFLKFGHSVMRGSRSKEKLSDWLEKNKQNAHIGNFEETANFGEIIVVAVKGLEALNALSLCGEKNLSKKIIIDVTNPISNNPPVNGVVNFFTEMNSSLMEQMQKKYPEVNFVKAFSSVGAPMMVQPKLSIKPTMFICGNSEPAKITVMEILEQFGWESEDCGTVEAARAIEPLCMLWCISGFRDNDWTHAFKMLR